MFAESPPTSEVLKERLVHAAVGNKVEVAGVPFIHERVHLWGNGRPTPTYKKVWVDPMG